MHSTTVCNFPNPPSAQRYRIQPLKCSSTNCVCDYVRLDEAKCRPTFSALMMMIMTLMTLRFTTENGHHDRRAPPPSSAPVAGAAKLIDCVQSLRVAKRPGSSRNTNNITDRPTGCSVVGDCRISFTRSFSGDCIIFVFGWMLFSTTLGLFWTVVGSGHGRAFKLRFNRAGLCFFFAVR